MRGFREADGYAAIIEILAEEGLIPNDSPPGSGMLRNPGLELQYRNNNFIYEIMMGE